MCPIDKFETEGQEMDEEPAVAWLEFTDHIWGIVTYPSAGFSSGRMQGFCQQLLTFTRELLTRPYDPVRSLPFGAPSGAPTTR
jgi:hypothetical protein